MYIPIWVLVLIAIILFIKYRKNNKKEILVQGDKKDLTYGEMLDLPEKEFQKMIISRDNINRQKLLNEMIEHEEKTSSFAKTLNGSSEQEAVVSIFNRNKSKEVIELFQKMDSILEKNDIKDKNDLVAEAIYAKSASDYFDLGNKIQSEKK